MRDDTREFGDVIGDLLGTIGLIVGHIRSSLNYLWHGSVNLREFWGHAYEVAWRTVSTVGISSFSIGMVSALQMAKYFASYGSLSEVGGVNALAQFRELSPLLTAIVLTGRLGSAWAAEIGTMRITEQISALKVMRISPEWFLVAPRVLASMAAMPILNVVAILASLVGGFLIAQVITPITAVQYFSSIKRYIDFYDVFVTSFKAVCFGATVASVSCSCGLSATGGAAGVGKNTTKAVVTCLLCLFALNYFLSFVFYSVLK
ncbi:MAG: ABC transporter permease [Candidatus Caenarcaniphilales bacterium]|nr:ABC transporter permease [Candidatus Caenarcaniphilales bacterium]